MLPLPSDSWLDGSESWWCHGGAGSCHSTNNSPKVQTVSSLSARPQDCLIGDSCIIVQFRSLNGCLLDASNKVLCTQCQYELGRLVSSGCVFFQINSFSWICFVVQ